MAPPSTQAEQEKTQTTQKDPSNIEMKSYWYPDREAELGEVESGLAKWNTETRFLLLLTVPVILLIMNFVIQFNRDSLDEFATVASEQIHNTHDLVFALAGIAFSTMLLVFIVTVFVLIRAHNVYLVDFAVFRPPDANKVPHERFMRMSKEVGAFEQDSIDFQEKLLYRTGLGQETYFPDGILSSPPEINMKRAREEAEQVFTGCLDELFTKTKLKPRDIDILVVNCSLFNPTPSIAEMIINKYKMRSNVIVYNLSGMGCSAGVVSLDLAKDLLQVHKNCNALVFSTENITQNWYMGKNKAMLISNTLFRMGGAAILLSNKRWAAWNAKYKLQYIVRVHKGASEKAYKAVFQEEDAAGIRGVALSKDLVEVAGDALKSNLTILGPMVLPVTEQVKFVINYVTRLVESYLGKKKTPYYNPDFKKAFEHFCIHAGGRAIIDGMEENLKLEPHHVEPSRATLFRYGNTSSSSIWYELNFIELSGRVKKGDRVLQIAFGSGFMCNSAVWKRVKA